MQGTLEISTNMFNKIVIPLDGSKLAEVVLRLARDLASQNNAELFLVNVQETPAYLYWMEAPVFSDAYADETHLELVNYMHRTSTMLNDAGLRSHVILTSGVPDQQIVAESKRLGADLIIMATHGYGGIPRLLLGSVADRVLHQSGIPVLLVRPDESDYPRDKKE